jgi:hypothetical protein
MNSDPKLSQILIPSELIYRKDGCFCSGYSNAGNTKQWINLLLVNYLLIMIMKDNVPLNQIHNVIIISTLRRHR